MTARLEHANITVSDPQGFAAMLCGLFDWQVRWEGPSLNGGTSVHVGGADSYVALYRPKGGADGVPMNPNGVVNGLNHLGVVVPDLKAVEQRVTQAGFVAHSHADYEPGQRFYFDGPDGVEIEVVSYD